jgi:2-dehydropantoate 2-reductase
MLEMNMKNIRILIIGAGVNGSVIASGLFNGGINITVLARGKRYEQLRDEGIVIEDPFKNTHSVTRVPVINSLDPQDYYDFILVVVRKSQIADLLPVLAKNKSPNIVFMGNNLTGPDEFVRILSRERVLMGSVYAAGKREDNLIRAMVVKSIAVPFGEIDGSISPRLQQLIKIFHTAGFKAKPSTNIVDCQTTHAVGVALIGSLIFKHGGDVKELAHSTDDLLLFIKARREGHLVLRALGRQIIPWSESLIIIMPDFLQVAGFRWLLNSKFGEVGLAHVSQAADEIEQLALELQALVDQAGLTVPSIRKVLE